MLQKVLFPDQFLVCSTWIPWSRPSSSCRVCNPEQKTLSQEAFQPIICHLPACQRTLSNHSTLLARQPRSAEAVPMQWERAEGCPPCFNKHWHYTQVFSRPCIHKGKFAFYAFTFCLANLPILYKVLTKTNNVFILGGEGGGKILFQQHRAGSWQEQDSAAVGLIFCLSLLFL